MDVELIILWVMIAGSLFLSHLRGIGQTLHTFLVVGLIKVIGAVISVKARH